MITKLILNSDGQQFGLAQALETSIYEFCFSVYHSPIDYRDRYQKDAYCNQKKRRIEDPLYKGFPARFIVSIPIFIVTLYNIITKTENYKLSIGVVLIFGIIALGQGVYYGKKKNGYTILEYKTPGIDQLQYRRLYLSISLIRHYDNYVIYRIFNPISCLKHLAHF